MRPQSTLRLIRQKEVIARTGLSRSHIRALELQGKFPGRLKLSARAVSWHEQEIADWIAARIAARDRAQRLAEISGGSIKAARA